MRNDRCVPSPSRRILSLVLVFSPASFPIAGPGEAIFRGPAAVAPIQTARSSSPAAAPATAGSPSVQTLPLRFERNVGQTDPEVSFLARSRSGDAFLTPTALVLRVREGARGPNAPAKSAVVRIQTRGSNPRVRVTGLDPLPGRTNYFIGNDPAKWRTNVPSFARVKYEGVYQGIDLVYYGNGGNLEYDFDVAPGADPARIALSVDGAEGIRIDPAGTLVLRTAAGEVRQRAPRIYQQDGHGRHEVAGGFVMRRDGRVGFALARYDGAQPLVIDPEVVYATYFGGSAETDIKAIAVDAAGSVYVTGDTYAHDFPTRNPAQPTNNHSQSLSAVVTKFSPDGRSLVYSTYLGGSDTFALDVAVGIAIDATGAAYITGTTGSADFPTRNAVQPSKAFGTDGFVSKLSADGSVLVYSTYLGGNSFDEPFGITLDSSNNAYVYGRTDSTDFPTKNPTQATYGGGSHDGFWSLLGAAGTPLLFSTYIGGSGNDDVQSLKVYSETGDAYVTGQRQPPNLATNQDRSPESPLDKQEWYVLHYKGLPFAIEVPAPVTGTIITIDDQGRKVVTHVLLEGNGRDGDEGQVSEEALPDIEAFISGGCVALPPATGCSGYGAIATVDGTTLELKSVTNVADVLPEITAAVRDPQGAVYVTGTAGSGFTSLVNPIQSVYGGSLDAFVAVFAPTTRQVLFSTYLGGSGHDVPNGIALDPQGNIYIAGQTTSDNFPTKNAYQATPPAPNGVSIGQGNSFIVKISGLNAPTSRQHIEKPPRRGSSRAVPPHK